MDRVKKLTKAQLLSEFQRISKENQPTKGTYIKTLKHEDIFEIPVNKTSTIYPIRNGKKKMLIPIEDEDKDKEASGIMTDKEVENLISILRNPHSKEILKKYLKQERERNDLDSDSDSDSD